MSSSVREKFSADPAWQYLRQNEEKFLQSLQSASRKYDPKRSVWVPDPVDGFVAAEIKAAKDEGHYIAVTKKGNEKVVPKEETQMMNPPKYELIEDMAGLTHLNEASVLYNLRQRYDKMMIYTYSGLFCVVINPYQRLPIYTENVCKMYIGRRRNEMPPHIFSVCDEAYRNMVNEQECQSMLITGESGAGKTENTKKVISYFAVVGSGGAMKKKSATEQKKEASLEDQIVRTNPVLEAFGNAKTVRNNNSSRFGKFIRIHFNNAGRLAGGDIEHYLLEKSRVIKQQPGERSYHIFYQIMSDGIGGLKRKLHLNRQIHDYHFVSQAEVAIDGVDDREEMWITDESFDIMKFTETEKSELFALVAGIMHMGEMRFKQRPREEQAEIDDVKEGEIACKLFGVDAEKFITAILKPKVKVGLEWVKKGQNLEQVNYSVGALAKALYARMFAWLISRCNATLDAKDRARDKFIGVLDIAGFEIFDLNSFEQLWINFVNERLQQFFNHHMFVLEQEEYEREGIEWTFIDFGLDLQACIELIERPLGIISMLDEECIVPKATDHTFVQKLNDQHLNKHPNYQKPKPPRGKQAEAHFAIVHYASTVQYNAKSWLEKNKDPLNDSVVAVLKAEPGMELLKAIWADYQTQEDEKAQELRVGGRLKTGKKKGKSSTFQTVSMIYRESLSNLIKMLNQTHPHFIRCIIPNEQKRTGHIEANLVLNQLTCNGVLEGIRICRKGFPNRVAYADFRQRYTILATQEAMGKDASEAGKRMCARMEREAKLKVDSFQCGKSKIFFRAGVLASLEEMRDDALSKVIVQFQRCCRAYLAQTELRRRLNEHVGVKIIQRNVRKWCAIREWPWFKLMGRVKPMIKDHRKEEEMEFIQKRCKQLEEDFQREKKKRKELEANSAELKAEKLEMELALGRERERLAEAEGDAQKLAEQKKELERKLEEMVEQLGEQEERTNGLGKARKKLEADLDQMRRQMAEMDSTIRRQESEKLSKDTQIRSLQDEISNLDETIGKLNKERKHQEEVNRKMIDELEAKEERIEMLSRTKQKLEQSLDKAEDALEKERRARQELDKQRRKTEGELKIALENLEEIGRQKSEMENAMKKKEAELQQMANRLEDEQSLVGRLQRQIKELTARVQELEEELDGERTARMRAEKARAELQAENEELMERMEEAGGLTQAQVELNKRREAEMAKLRREMEEGGLQAEMMLQTMKKKHSDAMVELSEQLELMQKARTKAEKEKMQKEKEMESLQGQLDFETKQRQNADRMIKHLEAQHQELQLKADEQQRQLVELQAWKARQQAEHGDLGRQLEEADAQMAQLNRMKAQMGVELEEARRQVEQESRDRQALASQVSNYQLECQQMREQMENEQDAKSELQRLVSKANAEAQQWRAKYESEGLLRAEELEEQRRKILAKSQEVQQQLEQANAKIVGMEKGKHRMAQELEDAQLQAERVTQMLVQLEKKQKGVDRAMEEWRAKCEALSAELEASQRETRIASTELYRLRTTLDEAEEQLEVVHRENKALAQELKDAIDQLSEGGKGVHELAKAKRRLELEKEELQMALDDAESALEAEENKLLRAQVEISQIRSEIEKRIAEKEEEFENTRKTHQRALDSMQASLDAEIRTKGELAKAKKKLESDIGEMEIGLDQANRANLDAQKNLKKYHDQVRELQQQVEEEQQLREQIQQQCQLIERKALNLVQEKEEALMAVEQAERGRRQADLDAQEMRETLIGLENMNATLGGLKRKLESDLVQANGEISELSAELRGMEEKAKKAIMDAAKLAEELRAEQEHAQNQERQRKALEGHVKELQQRMEEADILALKGGKKIVGKLEQRVHDLMTELESETRRHTETQKNLRGKERRIRELQFQVDEDKKSQERLYQLVEKLQQKLKTFKRQNEEAEQIASMNLTKYKQIQHMFEDAEERADLAENSLAKFRAKSRSTMNIHGLLSVGGGLRPSASSAAVFHHSGSSTAMLNHATLIAAKNGHQQQQENGGDGSGLGTSSSASNLMSHSIQEEE